MTGLTDGWDPELLQLLDLYGWTIETSTNRSTRLTEPGEELVATATRGDRQVVARVTIPAEDILNPACVEEHIRLLGRRLWEQFVRLGAESSGPQVGSVGETENERG